MPKPIKMLHVLKRNIESHANTIDTNAMKKHIVNSHTYASYGP